MQRLINQRAKLFGLFPSWKAIVTYAKKRIKFAINRKSDPFFQFEAEFFPDLFFVP